MADMKHFLDKQEDIIENFRFWKSYIYNKPGQHQFYFDTADIIDMLTGIQGLAQGYSFKWKLYDHPKQLVYAFAYREWLGSITLLQPHLTELYDKISTRHTLFPEYSTNIEEPIEEFWSEYLKDKKIRLLLQEGQLDHINEKADALLKVAPHIFQGIYLSQEDGFWKKRYKYLKEKGIIKFDTTPYDVIKTTKNPVFKALQESLNRQRSHNTSNNYIDAIALCLFDKKLKLHQENPSQYPLPLFYTDQSFLLKAAKEVSKEKFNNRHPLCIKCKDGKSILAVRDSNFFFLAGVLGGSTKPDIELFERIVNKLEGSTNGDLVNNEKTTEAKAVFDKDIIEEDTPKAFLINFFQQWWHNLGLKQLHQVYKKDYNLNEAEEKVLQTKINAYITTEREQLKKSIGLGYTIINRAWKDLADVEQKIKELYKFDIKIDAAHEFGSRFSFKKSVYSKIQEHFERMKSAAFGDEKKDLDEIKTETINFILDTLTGKSDLPEKERSTKLDNLASAIGTLWLLNKHELIDMICQALRDIPRLKKNKEDVYPSPAFAMMHAVTRLSLEEPNLDNIQEIIDCVEEKFNGQNGDKNYKVWMALSYVYYRMAAIQYPHIHQIPEDLSLSEKDSTARKKGLEYLEKTYINAEKTFKYLDVKINEEPNSEAIYRWRRVCYYATNNILFCKTLYAPIYELTEPDFMKKVHQFEDLDNPNLFHENRYSDTISRYYYRLSHHDKKPKFIKLAREYNRRSLSYPGIAEKRTFEILEKNIDRL